MIKIVKVTGTSLSPFFLPGEYVLVLRVPSRFNKLSPGDYAVFTHDDYGLLIKRIINNYPSEKLIEAEGNIPASVSAQEIGKIPYDDIVGKVIHRISGSS
jgi:signal peptidase I